MFHLFPNNENQEQRPNFISCPSLSMLLQGAYPSPSSHDPTSLPHPYPFQHNFMMVNGGFGMMGSGNFGAGNVEGLVIGQRSLIEEEASNGDGLTGMDVSSEINKFDLQAVKRNRRRSGAEVPEKIQQRMIKNREAAALSRAKKKAYDAQQREEIMQLKEENEQLRRTIRFLSATATKGEEKLVLKRSLSGPF
ncbi:hypothetical protein Dimus_014438 [Dionaea muscipula]